MTYTFDNMGLHPSILTALEAMQFQTPTPIQEKTIPLALQGLDIMGTAQTGTGKTAAYAIPVLQYLLNNPQAHTALVLTPTRELADQVHEAIRKLMGFRSPIKTALLIGGEPIFPQLRQLKRHPQLVVGTPGRVYDHIQRKTLSLRNAHFLVLDETDRMLDMGFSIQLDQIATYLPAKRQTLMFSATMAPGVTKVAERYLNEPTQITIGQTNNPAETVKQVTLETTAEKKYNDLITQIQAFDGACVIFVKTKFGADDLSERLQQHGFFAEAIHGGLHQRKRDRVIQKFRKNDLRLLVATDLAARGLDIPHLEYVINYDLPQCPEDYIHRIGRTGRAGAEGTAINLITHQDRFKWRSICKLMGLKDPYPPAPRRQQAGDSRFQGGKKPGRFGSNSRFKPAFSTEGEGKRRFSGGFFGRKSAAR